MLNGEDPHTHQHLSEENIRYQVCPPLIVTPPLFTQTLPACHFPYRRSRNGESFVFQYIAFCHSTGLLTLLVDRRGEKCATTSSATID